MPRKSRAEDEAEDMLIWPPPHAHQLLILLEDFVQNTHGAIPIIKDFKANPGVNKFKYIGLSDYKIYKNIFEKSNAIGRLGYSLVNPLCDVDEEANIKDRFLHPDNRRSDDDDEAFQDYIGGQHSRSKRVGPLSSRESRRKKRTTDADCVSTAIMEVASAMKSRVDISIASQRLNSEIVNKKEEFSLAACQKIVDFMGITPTAYLKAM